MTGISYQTALMIDLCTLFLCAVIALRITKSLLHPAGVMLAVHAYIVTVRLWQLGHGYRPMAYNFKWAISPSEIVRGSLASDAALIAIALGWVTVHFWGHRGKQHVPVEPRIKISDHRLHIAAGAALCVSVVATIIWGPHARVDTDPSVGSSGYITAAQEALGWGCCLLIFRYGFRWRLVALTVIALAGLIAVTPYRQVVIIPCVFLLFLWLIRRYPIGFPWAVLPAVLGLWLLWLPMKSITGALQAGDSVGEAVSTGFSDVFLNFGTDTGSGIDFQFLDMISSTMSLVDVHQVHFYGSTIVPVLVGPIPRALWPGKPELKQYQLDLDVPARAIAKLDMTAGLVGEAYANFGYTGVILIPFFLSVALSFAYRRLAGTSLLTPGCLLYLLYLSTYMQIYRDGLVSAIWFPFVHCAPVGWLAVSHWIWPPRSQTAIAPTHRPVSIFPGSYSSSFNSPTP